MKPPEINLALAWIWISLGFLSGLALGLFFSRPDWLGGYTSFKRRMLRLGHISFFGLDAVNLCFYFTAQSVTFSVPVLTTASWAFLVGAISMPICCLVVAWSPKRLLVFSVPVLSLLLAGALTVLAVVQQGFQPHPGAGATPDRHPTLFRKPSEPTSL